MADDGDLIFDFESEVSESDSTRGDYWNPIDHYSFMKEKWISLQIALENSEVAEFEKIYNKLLKLENELDELKQTLPEDVYEDIDKEIGGIYERRFYLKSIEAISRREEEIIMALKHLESILKAMDIKGGAYNSISIVLSTMKPLEEELKKLESKRLQLVKRMKILDSFTSKNPESL